MKKDTRGVRRRIACWLLAASAILSAGCYVTEINADGSGTLTREVVSPPGTDPQKFCPGAPKGYSATVEGRTYYWRLKLPGYVIRHSANQVSGNLLTWVVTSGQGVFRIEAESQLP